MHNHLVGFKTELQNNKRSEYTIIAYLKDVEQLLQFLIEKGIRTIEDTKQEDINAFFRKLKTDKYTPKSISRKLNSIRTFFKYLQKEKLIDHNPAMSVQHPKYDVQPPRVLSETEYRALRDAAHHDIRLLAIIELLLQTGIRIGELCRLTLHDIKLNPSKDAYIFVQAYSNNEGRKVPLNSYAQQAINAYLQIRPKTDNPTLFVTKTGNSLLVRNIRGSIDVAFKKAGIKNVKVNDLRNTFIAHHLAKGTNPLLISRIIGHKRLSTTEKYFGIIAEKNTKSTSLQNL